jgi:hypothetical protein
MINAEKTLVFASDFPHWDFNLPSTIYDLPFLSEQGKRNILGETARIVYNLQVRAAHRLAQSAGHMLEQARHDGRGALPATLAGTHTAPAKTRREFTW